MSKDNNPPPANHVMGDFLKPSTTTRGFGLLTFTDRNGTECTLQESSLATEAAIWLGAAKLEVKRFPGNYTGWHDVDFATLLPGQDIVGNERMHLTQDHVRSLLPALQHFAKTGELPTTPSPVQHVVSDEMIEAGLIKLKNNYRPLFADGVSIDEKTLVAAILNAALAPEGSDNG